MIYETTDIKLGAVILCEIPGTYLDGLDDKIVNSKRIIRIEYPAQYAQALNKVIAEYSHKIQLVNVFKYNRALCQIRDILKGNIHNSDRLQTKEMGNGNL